MHKCQKNVVIGALVGVIIGALIGAGTMQYAQLVAFKGANPNYMKNATNPRVTDSIIRERSDEGIYEAPLREVSTREARLRQAETAGHSAPLNSENEEESCSRFSFGSARYAKCVVELRDNDVEYQQWPSVPH